MKRFGSIFPFLESGRQSRNLGRLVANHDFVKALVTYGTFDEYVFANTSVSNSRTFGEAIREWELSDEQVGRVRLVSYPQLPHLLRTQPFHVFHLGGWGALMPGLHYIRSKHASNPWPITAVTHSLTGREIIDHAARLSHASMAPYDAVFCTSRDGRQAMTKLLAGGEAIAGRRYEGRLEHLPLGIDDDLLRQRGDRSRGRGRLDIPPEAVILLVLGRMTLTQKMDLTPLLRTLAREIVPRSPVPVCLLLAGAATADDLKLVTDSVERYGLAPFVRIQANFSSAHKADLLAAADIAVSPVDNAQETFGLSLLEAMGAGIPVVASRFDGYKDLVTDGIDGFLIDTVSNACNPMDDWFDLLDPNIAQLYHSQGIAVDQQQLARRVLELVINPDLRFTFGASGKAKVTQHYVWSRVVCQYEKMWDVLAESAADTGLPRTPAAGNAFALAPSGVFSHYSSHTLNAQDRVRAVVSTLDDTPYNECTTLLTPRLLNALLAGAQQCATLQSIVENADFPEDHGRYGVAWLLKYGFLELIQEG